MKTTTIFDAWKKSYDRRLDAVTWDDYNQYLRFETALLRRIEAGDRARAIVREIAKIYSVDNYDEIYGQLVRDVINRHSDWLEELT